MFWGWRVWMRPTGFNLLHWGPGRGRQSRRADDTRNLWYA